MPQNKIFIRVEKMPDKRFYVRYSFGIWGRNHRQYFDTLKEAQEFIFDKLLAGMFNES